MKRSKLPVVAVIPAFNAETTLEPLLKTALEQGYGEVCVLDDASTDNTYELAKSLRPDVTVIRGHENLGAGGNRNRILHQIGYYSIFHLIDSDTSLNSERTPEIIQDQ